MERVLVTGATGFLGSRLVRLLNETGKQVRIFRRPGSGLGNLQDCFFDDFAGDLESGADWKRALDGRDTVFHLAACTSLLRRDREKRRRVNVGLVKVITGLLRGFPGVRLLHCSSAGAVRFSKVSDSADENSVFGAGGVDYFVTKKMGEDIVREAVKAGLDAVIVNPSTVIGPLAMRGLQAGLFARALKGRLIFYPPGGSSFAFSGDVARGMMLASEKGRAGERYILGGHNLTFKEYFSRVAEYGGHRGPETPLPGFLFPWAGAVCEAFFGAGGADAGRLAAGFGYYSSRKAESELGYRITPLGEILAKMKDRVVLEENVPA